MSNRLQVTEFLILVNDHIEKARDEMTSALVRADSFLNILDTDDAKTLRDGIEELRNRMYDDEFDQKLEGLILLSVQSVLRG